MQEQGRGSAGGRDNPRVALAVTAISKDFGINRVLDGVSLEVGRGEVLALLGENGAGKTTLMRIVAGLETRDAGSIRVGTAVENISSPADALAQGIVMVHQHFSLVGNLSVAENVLLGTRRGTLRAVRNRAIWNEVESVAARYSIDVDVRRRVDELSIDAQANVEILKALYRGARVLILDEPTSSLGPKQIEELFATVRRMAQSGLAVVLVSHRLREVKEISDNVVVLRAGVVAAAGATAGFSEADLTRAMIGQDLVVARGSREAKRGEAEHAARLRVIDLEVTESHQRKLDGISFDVVAGRVLGVVGVEGNGQTELLEVLAGIRGPTGGHIYHDGVDVTGWSPLELHGRKVVSVSGDRQRWDIVPGFTAAENLALHRIALGEHRRRGGLIDWNAVEADAVRLFESFDIRPRATDQRIERFSGGNQQKLVIARAMDQKPEVLVLGQPTRGLDLGARQFVHNEVLAARDDGVAIIVVSFDMDELFDLADDVIVLFRGRVSYAANRGTITKDAVGAAMTGTVDGAESQLLQL